MTASKDILDAPSGRPVVEFDNVSFAYESIPVLEQVTMRVAEGEFASVVGPNGGGKTTLLRLMLGLLRPASGEVRVLGVSPQAARGRVGYVPQHAVYDPHFPATVFEVVLMGRLGKSRLGFYRREDREAARHALAEARLEGIEKQPFRALSGGQRQRVLIARALAGMPELLLLDEPMSNVDALAESRLIDTLQQLNRRMTILLVSHDLGFVSQVVQSVICVNRRVVVHPTSEITGQVIQEIYGGDIRMVRHDHRCAEEGHSHG